MDSDQEQDLDKLLGTWLGELETMTKQLDGNGIETNIPIVPISPPPPTPTSGNLDNFRFSMANLEARMQQMQPHPHQDTQDVDLDALLGDLCQMEKELQWQADQENKNEQSEDPLDILEHIDCKDKTDSDHSVKNGNKSYDDSVFAEKTDNINRNGNGNGNMNVSMVSQAQHITVVPECDPATPTDLPTPPVPATPIESPASETWPSPPPHAARDNSSQGSALQSPSTPTEKMSQSVRARLESLQDDLSKGELSEDERIARIKAEKIRIALEKIKEARIKKLIIRVYTDDGSSKTVLVDENMTVRDVCHILVEKNHFEESPNWVLVSRFPDLYMERVLEDHENLVNDVLSLWPRETNNSLLFTEKREKYALFKNPQHYLLATKSSNTAQEFAEKTKQDLIDEFFLSGANSVPELEGGLYLKAEGKKSWKKHFCMLRGSGIYYCPKGKSKSLKDLVCYVQFEHIDVYNGVGWKKKYKCPSDFCFALKHPQIMQKSKYIKYLCAEDYRTTQKWITAIRIAKYGKQLHMSYKLTQKEMRDNGSNLSSLRSSDTSSMTSMQSSSSTQSSQGTASMASPASSQSSSSAIPQSSVTRSKSDKSNLMTNTSSRNTQEMSSSGSISGRSGTFSHKVGDVFANAWKIGSEMQQQQKQEDRMSVSSTLTVDSFSSESQSQSSKSSVELTSGTPQTKHPVIGVPLPGILKPSPTHHAVEPPKHANVDMDIQSQLLQLELDLEKQKTYNPTHQQISPWSSPVASKSGTDEVDGNANAITKVHVTAKDTEAVSVIVKPPTGLTKHESLKKSKPPPPPKRSADTVTTLSRSVSVGSAARGGISPLRDSQKHVQFKESPDISSSAPARPSSDERFPPPPFPVYQRYSACSTPTTPSFPAPPSPLTPGFQAGLTSPPTPNYPAPPPWIPADNESRPRAATSTDKVSNLAMNAGFLADLQKAIRGPPQNPQQETGEKKAPPPPPKRSGESATSRSSKKHPPPPPQRFT